MPKNPLKTSDSNFKLIIENMVDGLFTVDENCTITYWNKAAEEILGYTQNEIVGKKCDFLNSPTCMGLKLANKEGKCALFTKGRVVRKRCIVKAKDGKEKHLLKNAQLIRDKNNKITGGIENIVDITEQIEKEQEIALLREKLKGKSSFHKIIGNHFTMQNIYSLVELAKDSSASVLITGESGTGKELVAHAIHHSSSRKKKPLVKVNCAAFAETLLESELFGHVKGAFTDAIKDRKGRFEEAIGGTIFLDEIGDIPLDLQVKLLRVLQEKEIEKVGDNRPVKVDVRIIAATNKDIPLLINSNRFREDLYYRINVIPIKIPPLRERRTDIPLLIDHFIKQFNTETGRQIVACDKKTLSQLMNYDWPGNVRELENTIEFAFVTCRTDCIRTMNIPEQIKATAPKTSRHSSREKDRETDKYDILQALKVTKGNKTRAAEILGFSRITLWKKMNKLGLTDKPINI